jgi:hypothetical protein
VPGDPLADLASERLRRCGGRPGQVATKRDKGEVVVLEREDAAVVVVDQLAELVGDRPAYLPGVVQPAELPGNALQHLEVRYRPDVLAAGMRFAGTLGDLVEDHDHVLAA